MDFKEEYRKEMEHIKRNKRVDLQVLNSMDVESSATEKNMRVINFRRWRVAAVVCVVAIMALVGMNYDQFTAYAKSMYGSYVFSMGKETILLDEIIPLEFDYDSFEENKVPKIYEFTEGHEIVFNAKYGDVYENDESFYEKTGINLPGTLGIDYQIIHFTLQNSKKGGHVSVDFMWDNEDFHINGLFITKLYEDGKVGYGEQNNAYYSYEYAEGKWAYFVRDSMSDKEVSQRVYFAEGGFIFQLFVENSAEGTETAKEIIEAMAE